MISGVVIISFILDGLVSLCCYHFIPLFSVVSLILIYPYFKRDSPRFYLMALGMGLMYDVIYTNTFILNMLVFLLIAYLVKAINNVLSNNPYMVTLMSLIIVTIYQFVTFMVLVITGYHTFNINKLFTGTIYALPLNIIYVFAIYLITDYLSKKYRIIKSN